MLEGVSVTVRGRVESLPRWVKDLGAVAALAFGFCILVHPLFVIAAAICSVAFFDTLYEQYVSRFARVSFFHLLIPVAMFSLFASIAHPLPSDDLLRNVVSHEFNYDYSNLYAHAPLLPSHNLWFGFEYLLSGLVSVFGKDAAVRVVQISCFILVYSSILFALYSKLKDRSDVFLYLVVFFVLSLYTSIPNRILLGRPEIFFAALVVSATFLRPVAWFLVGVLMAPLYWLAPIYSVGALLLNTSLKNRLLYMGLLTVISSGVWFFYSEGAWINSLLLVGEWDANRQGMIGELTSLLSSIGTPASLLLVCITAVLLKMNWGRLTLNHWMLLVVIVVFSIPNLNRYAATVIMLVSVLLATLLPGRVPKVNAGYGFLVVALATFVAMKAGGGLLEKDNKHLGFEIPANSVVLTQFGFSEYSTIFENPDSKYAPAYEFGATDKKVQLMIKDLITKGELSCDDLHEFGFTHVIEDSLEEVSPCLDLKQLSGEYRLWEVK